MEEQLKYRFACLMYNYINNWERYYFTNTNNILAFSFINNEVSIMEDAFWAYGGGKFVNYDAIVYFTDIFKFYIKWKLR